MLTKDNLKAGYDKTVEAGKIVNDKLTELGVYKAAGDAVSGLSTFISKAFNS